MHICVCTRTHAHTPQACARAHTHAQQLTPWAMHNPQEDSWEGASLSLSHTHTISFFLTHTYPHRTRGRASTQGRSCASSISQPSLKPKDRIFWSVSAVCVQSMPGGLAGSRVRAPNKREEEVVEEPFTKNQKCVGENVKNVYGQRLIAVLWDYSKVQQAASTAT